MRKKKKLANIPPPAPPTCALSDCERLHLVAYEECAALEREALATYHRARRQRRRAFRALIVALADVGGQHDG